MRFTKNPDPDLVDKIKTKPHGSFVQWTLKEHEMLISAVKQYEKDWRNNVNKIILTKTGSQIQSHFRYHYAQALNDRSLPNAKLFIDNYPARRNPKISLCWYSA